jgi:hypothetical protein
MLAPEGGQQIGTAGRSGGADPPHDASDESPRPPVAQQKTWQQTLQELWELLRDYARQETVGPLKSLGVRVGKGLLGSVLVALGYFLIVLAVMRFLQTHYSFTMDHNWIPYGVAVVMIAAMMFVAYKRMTRSELRPTPPVLPATTNETGDRA